MSPNPSETRKYCKISLKFPAISPTFAPRPDYRSAYPGQPKTRFMGHRREFEIAFVGLKPGVHHYEYEIGDEFFVVFQQQDFSNCRASVKLTLEKNNNFMLFRFEIGGRLDVTCDRCNNQLPLDLWDEFNLTVKMVADPELMNDQEEDPDVFYISNSESHVDVANWIYEFINLSIPMQRSCDFEKMDGPYCNRAALDVLKKMNTTEDGNKDNPIWKELKKFKHPDT
jgi:uncharacterized metal-binding protein YceD (DUF177 family)